VVLGIDINTAAIICEFNGIGEDIADDDIEVVGVCEDRPVGIGWYAKGYFNFFLFGEDGIVID